MTKRQKELLLIIYKHIKNSGYPPTFEEMRESLNVSSNQAVIDLLTALGKARFIIRNDKSARSITIRPTGYEAISKKPLIRVVGTTAAGPATEAIEQNEWVDMPSGFQQYKDVFLVKVTGNSMIEADIYDGDIVLIKKEKQYKSGDIVLARMGDDVTLKRFVYDKGRTYLKAENPGYRSIPITHDTYFLGKMVPMKEG